MTELVFSTFGQRIFPSHLIGKLLFENDGNIVLGSHDIIFFVTLREGMTRSVSFLRHPRYYRVLLQQACSF